MTDRCLKSNLKANETKAFLLPFSNWGFLVKARCEGFSLACSGACQEIFQVMWVGRLQP
jgi:hypothetical protein